jgi:SAM-dependent methyltransferase
MAVTRIDDGPRCVCGATGYLRLLEGEFNRIGVTGYRFGVWRCRVCGLARTLPVPDEAMYDAGNPMSTGSEREFIGHSEDVWSDGITSFVRRFVPSGRFLDVGAHSGLLVAAAAKAGFEALGVDPDPTATEYARTHGRTVLTARLDEAGFEDGSFDAVVFAHTLEHIADLPGVLREARRILAPGGHLFVFVPHFRGLMPRLMRDHWMGWFATQHVWQFEPHTLTDVVRRYAALEPVWVKTEGVIEPPSTGVKGAVKAVVNRVSRLTKTGDQIEAVFKKPT